MRLATLLPPTTRYFVHKLPIFLAGRAPNEAGTVPHLVHLVNEPTGHGLEQFLADHARLLAALPAWTVAVCPDGPGLHASRVERYRAGTTTARVPGDATELRWYFHTRRVVEQGELRDLSVDDIRRYQTIRGRRNGAGTEGLYASWLRGGDAAIEAVPRAGGRAIAAPAGTLWLRELPFRYSQFGALPGVA